MEVTSSHILQIALSSVLFLALWQVLNYILYKPYFKILEEREQRTTGAESDAVVIRNKAKQVIAEYEIEVKSTRKEGASLREELVQRAKSDSEIVMRQIEAEAEAKLTAARSQLVILKSKVSSEADQEAVKIADQIINKILNQSSSKRVVH